jgi:Cft2 family RNA processing exonuclease
LGIFILTNSLLQFEVKDLGLVISNSILSLDVSSSDGMSFISEPSIHPVASKQIIMSEEASRLMEAARIKTNAMLCQYNRPFMIGNYKLELLPSGSLLGGASLFIETKNNSVLYAPRITLQKHLLTRKAQLRKAKTLVLKTHSSAQKSYHSIKREKERLISWVLQIKATTNTWPIIYAPAFGTAQEVIRALDQSLIPTIVHTSIARINDVYKAYDFNIGSPGVWSKRSETDKVVIIPSPVPFGRRLHFTMMRPSAVVHNQILSFESAMIHPSNISHFLMDSSPTINEIKEIIKEVEPSRLFIFGNGAKSHLAELKDLAEESKALYEFSYPTLF